MDMATYHSLLDCEVGGDYEPFDLLSILCCYLQEGRPRKPCRKMLHYFAN